MSNFKGQFLLIETPVTTDGINLKMTEDRQPIYKESHAPMSALKAFERENAGRPAHLKHIITVMGSAESYRPEPPAPKVSGTQNINTPSATRKRGRQPSNQTI